jgi:hypothetical protein
LNKSHDTASCPGGSQFQVLKNLPDPLFQTVLYLLIDILKNEELLYIWKLSTVKYILKTSKNHNEPSNYHELAFISCVCKERVINYRFGFLNQIKDYGSCFWIS